MFLRSTIRRKDGKEHRYWSVVENKRVTGVFEKFAAVQMIDVHIPTTDGRELQLIRYTQPEPELMLLLDRLKLELPQQPPPKITAAQAADASTV